MSVTVVRQRSTRTKQKPARFHDETFNQKDTYDRCHGGYMWPAKMGDRNYYQPKRDAVERLEEKQLVKSINDRYSQQENGYVMDDFVVMDDDDE